jgi:hypothetical protein
MSGDWPPTAGTQVRAQRTADADRLQRKLQVATAAFHARLDDKTTHYEAMLAVKERHYKKLLDQIEVKLARLMANRAAAAAAAAAAATAAAATAAAAATKNGAADLSAGDAAPAPTLEQQHEKHAARGEWAVHVTTGRAKHHRNAQDDKSIVEESKD